MTCPEFSISEMYCHDPLLGRQVTAFQISHPFKTPLSTPPPPRRKPNPPSMAGSLPPFPSDESLDFDLDSFFDSIPPDLTFDLLDDLPPIEDESRRRSVSGSTEADGALWVDDIERFLMEDEGVVGGDMNSGEFLSISDVLVDGLEDGNSSKSSVGDGGATTPETAAEEAKNDLEEARSEGEDDDAAVKKRRRQLRNRDSAMKSRERRKLYVQDLEKKNKYLEMECRRLQHLLQCCTAENVALQQCLQKDRLHVVPGVRQESAVLFEESLLLGSLLWLVNIVFLFLAPYLLLGLNMGRAAVTESARSLGPLPNQENVGAKRLGKKSKVELSLAFSLCRRRFKAFKRKMKYSFISLVFTPMLFSCMVCS